MASPFSQTMQSRRVNLLYVSLAGLICAIVLAVVWGHWFVTARITEYEISRKVAVTEYEAVTYKMLPKIPGGPKYEQGIRQRVVIAVFSPQALARIRVGQQAWLRLNRMDGTQTGTISSTVIEVRRQSRKKTGQVMLRSETLADEPDPFGDDMGGEVTIAVDYVTPAALLLRASGF